MLYFACLCKVNKLSRVSRVIRFLCVALLRTFLFWVKIMDDMIRKRIVHLRKLAGYNQADMAKILNIKHSTYAKREKHGKLDVDFLLSLSQILNVEVSDFLWDVNEPLRKEKENEVDIVVKASDNIKPKEPEINYKAPFDYYEGTINALASMASTKRIALQRLILVVSDNRGYDIVSEVNRIIKEINPKNTYGLKL